jgi:polyisoprenoid-binding protein YceI
MTTTIDHKTVDQKLARFDIDAKASLFTVQAFAAGMIAVVAHSPKFAIRDIVGQIQFIPGSLQKGSVELTINVGSLELMDEVSSADRREIERVMFDEVLEKKLYPRVEYKSARVSVATLSENTHKVSVAGDLTLHGITRGMGVDAQVVAGEDAVRAQGSFSITQVDYGLKVASIAGGTLKLRDELKFVFYIIGRRKD